MAKRSRARDYAGRLTAQQISDGSNAAFQNAKRLRDDARLLLARGSAASAITLALLAIEEHGKLSILDGIGYAIDDRTLKHLWRDYRNHSSKNLRAFLPSVVDQGSVSLAELAAVIGSGAKHGQYLEELKQLCTYTDCHVPQGAWSRPSDHATKELAAWLIEAADRLLHPDRVFTPEEFALRIQCMARVNDLIREARRTGTPAPIDSALAILEEYDAEAQRRGIPGAGGARSIRALFAGGTIDLRGAGRPT